MQVHRCRVVRVHADFRRIRDHMRHIVLLVHTVEEMRIWSCKGEETRLSGQSSRAFPRKIANVSNELPNAKLSDAT